MCCWSGSSPLASGTPSVLDMHLNSWTSCSCPESDRSCSYCSTGPGPTCAPAGHRWGRCWGVPTQRPRSVSGWWLGCSQQATGTTLLRWGVQPAPPHQWRGGISFHKCWGGVGGWRGLGQASFPVQGSLGSLIPGPLGSGVSSLVSGAWLSPGQSSRDSSVWPSYFNAWFTWASVVGNGHQHRSQLWQNYRDRHGHQQQLLFC